MAEIKTTTGETIIVDDEMFPFLSIYNWYLHPQGYAHASFKDSRWHSVLMHRLLMAADKGQIIDHVNGNKLDNRISNLRFCTTSQNFANKGLMKNNKSKYKGVWWDKVRKLWRARLNINKKEIYLGRYKQLEDAVNAYNIGAVKFFGEFARVQKI